MSSDDKIFYSSDLSNGNQIGLFDRIINIKFTRKNGDTFTLRSDYEPVWSGDKLYFITCQPKPEIRVQYTQYQSTMIGVDIFITNLNIIESPDSTAMDDSMINAGIAAVSTGAIQGNKTNQSNDALTRLGNQVIRAEIEMGYRGQFDNWAQYNNHSNIKPEDAYSNFLDLKIIGSSATANDDRAAISELTDSQIMFRQYRKCYVEIEWAANINNPPDRITQFHGYVGTTEPGFQPVTFQTVDCGSVAGSLAVMSQDNIFAGLDDEYTNIDEVPIKSTIDPKTKEVLIQGVDLEEKDLASLVLNKKGSKSAFRNFFNGGKGFTLLEGYCFHMVTRRFVRSSVVVKRNALLEQAALEFNMATNNTNVAGITSSKFMHKMTQDLYGIEDMYHPTYFKRSNPKDVNSDLITDTTVMPSSYYDYLQKTLQDTAVEQYVGPRYTIKNLPEYRRVYIAIRNKLADAAKNKQFMSWWAAAEGLTSKDLNAANVELNNSTYKNKAGELLRRQEYMVEDNIDSVRNYTLDLEQGGMAFQDCYFDNITNDYILPVQNISSSVPVRDGKGNILTLNFPTTVTATGFGGKTKQNVRCFTGLFETRDAYMFGVPVLCSVQASLIVQNKYANRADVDVQFFSDAQGQISWICEKFGLKYYRLHNGGYYIYAPGESARETASQTFVTGQSYKPFRIPAIYDMTLSPIRKIRMPFVAFLDPMTLVEWNSSAMIGTMISFYYQPDKGRNFFVIIKSTIDFSTTGEYNTMELELVDSQYVDPTDVPEALTSQQKSDYNKPVFTEVLIIPDSQMDTWRKIYDSPIAKIPVSMMPQWPNTIGPEVTKDDLISEDGRVSNHQFFALMYTWNNSLFAEAFGEATGFPWDDSRKRIDSQADDLYGGEALILEGEDAGKIAHFPDIMYCMQQMGKPSLNRIYMQFPLMPNIDDYNNMKNNDNTKILVYQSGVWQMMMKTDVPSSYKIGAD